jgi:hypothetical protein
LDVVASTISETASAMRGLPVCRSPRINSFRNLVFD